LKPRKSTLIIAVACLAIGVLAWWMWPSQQANVILITVDTLRPDRLSAYGYEKHRTPNFDRLAREGALFENAFCDVTWTTPSMASVMTGRYPTVHRIQSSFQRLSPEAITLAEVLLESGFHTAAIMGSFPLHSVFGLNQGFQTYDDTFSKPLILPASGTPPVETERGNQPTPRPDDQAEMVAFIMDKALNDAYRPDDQVSDRVIRWLREERQEPFFLWVHYFGPHEKPQPTEDLVEVVRLQVEQYDPDVVFADEQVGRVLAVLDELRLTDSTAVIVHADHGQSLMEHHQFGHGRNLYDPNQRIPMLMRLPGVIPKGQRVTRTVRNVDILPTVLDLTHVRTNIPLDGVSLLPIIAGKNVGGGEEAYAETYLPALRMFSDSIDESTQLGFRRLGIRTPEWKFIVNDPHEFMDVGDQAPLSEATRQSHYSEQLFDLRYDPGEERDVVNEHRDVAQHLRNRVMAYQNMSGPRSETMPLNAADRERLRSLGYLVE
jgi:arylsulfatase A-like enzyme